MWRRYAHHEMKEEIIKGTLFDVAPTKLGKIKGFEALIHAKISCGTRVLQTQCYTSGWTQPAVGQISPKAVRVFNFLLKNI